MEMTPVVQDGSRGGKTEHFCELVKVVGGELRQLLAHVESDVVKYPEENQQEIRLAQKVSVGYQFLSAATLVGYFSCSVLPLPEFMSVVDCWVGRKLEFPNRAKSD
jgi:hypothetical protein